MCENGKTGKCEKTGSMAGKDTMGIATLSSVRARIIFMSMGAIVIVGMTLIAILLPCPVDSLRIWWAVIWKTWLRLTGRP